MKKEYLIRSTHQNLSHKNKLQDMIKEKKTLQHKPTLLLQHICPKDMYLSKELCICVVTPTIWKTHPQLKYLTGAKAYEKLQKTRCFNKDIKS